VRPTKHSGRWVVVLLILAGLAAMQVSACSGTTEEEGGGGEAASVEPIKGTSYNTIKLSADAGVDASRGRVLLAELYRQEPSSPVRR